MLCRATILVVMQVLLLVIDKRHYNVAILNNLYLNMVQVGSLPQLISLYVHEMKPGGMRENISGNFFRNTSQRHLVNI